MTERTGEPVLTAEEWDRLLDYLEVNAPADVDDVIAVLEVRAHRAEKAALTPSQPVPSGRIGDGDGDICPTCRQIVGSQPVPSGLYDSPAVAAAIYEVKGETSEADALIAKVLAALPATTAPAQPVPSGLDVERLASLVVSAFTEFATEGERAQRAGWHYLTAAYGEARKHPAIAARLTHPVEGDRALDPDRSIERALVDEDSREARAWRLGWNAAVYAFQPHPVEGSTESGEDR